MKQLFAAAILGISMAGAAYAADPIVGTWQTTKDDNGNSGQIAVTECGAAICCTLVQSFDANNKPFESANKGRKTVWDMKNAGGGNYGGGQIYFPDRDKP